jgi:hypothetical protein
LAEFHCPICDASVFAPMSQHSVRSLLLLGATKVSGVAPLELTEEKSGPPVSLDDLFELHFALEEICCPQAELIGRS